MSLYSGRSESLAGEQKEERQKSLPSSRLFIDDFPDTNQYSLSTVNVIVSFS